MVVITVIMTVELVLKLVVMETMLAEMTVMGTMAMVLLPLLLLPLPLLVSGCFYPTPPVSAFPLPAHPRIQSATASGFFAFLQPPISLPTMHLLDLELVYVNIIHVCIKIKRTHSYCCFAVAGTSDATGKIWAF